MTSKSIKKVTSEDLSRAEYAFAQIRARLRNGELRAGQRLREAELAELLNISRTPVREAIRRLASDGLVEIAAGRGLIVAEFDKNQVRELYALRGILEGAAAQLAARHASPAEIEMMEEILARSANALSSSVETMKLNTRFHNAIHEAAHNRYLEKALAHMSDSLALLPGTTFAEPGRPTQAHEEHTAILEALQRRQPDEAEKAARHHIEMAGITRLRMMFADIG